MMDTSGNVRRRPRASMIGLFSLLLVLAGALHGANVGSATPALADSPVNGNIATWTKLNPAQSPHLSTSASTAYDPATGQIILFGGMDDNTDEPLGDTWAWDGSTWTKLNVTGPPARLGASMAYDPAIGGVVLFGGWSGSGALNATCCTLNDVWVFKGGAWTKSTLTGGPEPRVFASMAFDSATGQLVLYGGAAGLNSRGVYVSTWVLTGNVGTGFAWRQAASSGPSARSLASMTFDPATGQLVLFGGNTGDLIGNGQTWGWNGSAWTLLSSTGPQGRFAAPMAFDGATGQLILFGGFTGGSSGGFHGDTWNWDGGAWTQLSPPSSPPQGSDGMMTFDPATGQLVLFGGGRQYVNYYDTWVFQIPTDGLTWSKANAAGPEARSSASIAFDSAAGQVILFGGQNTSVSGGQAVTTVLGDTWARNGDSWTRLSTSGPSPRAGASMAFDEATGQLILFGGRDGNGNFLQDTWSWNGTTWSQLNPVASPPARADASMTFDSATGEIVLFGGTDDSGALADTWAWYGDQWGSGAAGPAARSGASMAFDPATGQVVLYGGQASDGSTLADTWTRNTDDQWYQATPGASPPATATDSAMDFDQATGQMVLFSCCDQGVAPSTWTWDGSTWNEAVAQPGNNPDSRFDTGAAFDPATRQFVLFGGTDLFGLSLGDTWTSLPIPRTALTVAAVDGTYSGTTGFSATLTYGGSYVSGETVSFSLNGNPVCGGSTGVTCPTTNGNGVATLPNASLVGLNTGAYPSSGSCSASAGVSASFSGDNPVLAASACNSLQVHPEVTSPSITQASPANPVYGQPITFTVQVFREDYVGTIGGQNIGGSFDDTLAVPTGSVAYSTLCGSEANSCQFEGGTVALNNSDNGTFTFTTTVLTPGNGRVYPYAVYTSDNPNISGSESNDIPNSYLETSGVFVNPANTTTTVSAGPSVATPGQNVTLTATVAPDIDFTPLAGTKPPAGSVTFYDGSVDSAHQIGAGTLSTDATTGTTTAAITTNALPAGKHTILAVYTGGYNPNDDTGDPNYNQSTTNSGAGVQVAYHTTTTLTSSANPSVFGQSLTYTAAVAGPQGSGTPTGSVQFSIDGTNVGGAVTLDGNGQATYTTSALAVTNGTTHTVTASYAGDDSFLASSGSLSGGQEVDRADTTVSLTSSANPSVLHQTVTFTASVAAKDPGSGTPGGTVTLKDGTATLGTGTLSGGTATVTTSSLTVGTHSITASYSGDENFTSSAGSALSQQVRYTVNVLSTSALTIVLQLQDYGNANVSASSIPVTAECVVASSQTAPTICGTAPVQTIKGGTFAFNRNWQGKGGAYQFQVSGKNLSKGQAYELLVRTGADPIWHAVQFTR